MATPDLVNTDPFCDVDLMPLNETSGKYSVVRLKSEADPEVFIPIESKGAIHGESYRLVPNTQVRQIAEDVLTRTGMAFEPLQVGHDPDATKNRAIVWDGKKYAQRWFMPEVSMDVNGGDLHRMMLGVQAINSYDGSYKVGLQFFMMACQCLNQFHTGNMLGSFTFNHFDRGDSTLEHDIEEAIQLIGNQAEMFTKALPKLQWLMAQDDPSMADYLKIRNQLNALRPSWPSAYDPHVLDELSHCGVTSGLNLAQTSGTGNLWGLLNAYTAVTTHKVGGFRGAELSRAVTDHFVGMAPKQLAA
jgi:hypothetical protein